MISTIIINRDRIKGERERERERISKLNILLHYLCNLTITLITNGLHVIISDILSTLDLNRGKNKMLVLENAIFFFFFLKTIICYKL